MAGANQPLRFDEIHSPQHAERFTSGPRSPAISAVSWTSVAKYNRCGPSSESAPPKLWLSPLISR
jgi:hypothetical protein